MARLFVATALLQALEQHNPASHGIWYVAGLTLAVLAAIVAVGVVDWLREVGSRRAAGAPPVDERDRRQRGDGIAVREPGSRLRRRFFRRLRPRRRS